jgi:DNA-binding NarL/FixJ family response regulator
LPFAARGSSLDWMILRPDDHRNQEGQPGEMPVAEKTHVRVTESAADQDSHNELRPDVLTNRETEVLKCIAEGHSTKQVAGMLGITFNTAACHRYRIMDKLGIHETAALVRYAIRNGLIEV